jgi:hypothetical protein
MGDGQAEGLRGLEVEDKLEFRGVLVICSPIY